MAGFLFFPTSTMPTPPQRGMWPRPVAEYVPLHWRGGGYADGVVREYAIICVLCILCHSQV